MNSWRWAMHACLGDQSLAGATALSSPVLQGRYGEWLLLKKEAFCPQGTGKHLVTFNLLKWPGLSSELLFCCVSYPVSFIKVDILLCVKNFLLELGGKFFCQFPTFW